MLATARLQLRALQPDDADFIIALVNDPVWLRYIGDRNIHDHAAAAAYLERDRTMRQRHGVGLLAVTLRQSPSAIGVCGLLRREHWEEIDLGYAFLPQYRGQGYAREAAAAVLDYGHDVLQRPRIVALTHPENTASVTLLSALGFTFERAITSPDGGMVSRLFVHVRA